MKAAIVRETGKPPVYGDFDEPGAEKVRAGAGNAARVVFRVG